MNGKKMFLKMIAVTGGVVLLSGFALAEEIQLVEIQREPGVENSDLPFLKDARYGVRFGDDGTDGRGNQVNENLAYTCNFKDIAGTKYEKQIMQLQEKGIVGGRKPCYFEPEKNILRGEATAMVVRANEMVLEKDFVKPFPDTDMQSWDAKFISTGKRRNVVHGYPDGNFRSMREVNKVESYKIVSRGFELDYSSNDFVEISKKYKNIDSKQWYAKYVKSADSAGLINGTEVLIPDDKYSREEFANIIWKALNLK